MQCEGKANNPVSMTKFMCTNSLAVNEGVALFKIACRKKVVKSKGVAKKWL